LSTSSSYVQRSQGNLASQTKYNTTEQSSSYVSNARNTYASVDASRVRAQGDGLSRAYRNEKASFTVDTREGGKPDFDIVFLHLCLLFIQGNAMLMVGVFGPKYPCEEVFIKHIGNNQYNVQYVNHSFFVLINILLTLF
jgi:filamin